MRSSILLLVLLIISAGAVAQQPFNINLKKELDSIYVEDQKYRALVFSEELKNKPDSIAAFYKVDKKDLINFLMTRMQNVDSTNMVRIKEITRQFGYPGKSLVGLPTNEAVFFVIQHSQSIDEYLPVIKKQPTKKNSPLRYMP